MPKESTIISGLWIQTYRVTQSATDCVLSFLYQLFNNLTLENVYYSNKYIKLVKQNLRMSAISNEVTVSCEVDCKVKYHF